MHSKHPRETRTYPPYYGATLGVIFLLYCWTIGDYLSDAPKSWVHSKLLAIVISLVLFLGGMELCYLVFDRLYPKLNAQRTAKGITTPPLLVRVVAFCTDLGIALVASVVLASFALGQATSNGFNLTGWRSVIPVVLTCLYFFIMNKYLGGTLAKRMFRIV